MHKQYFNTDLNYKNFTPITPYIAFALFTVMVLFSSFAYAEDSYDNPANEQYAQARAFPEHNVIKANETVTIATEITLKPHWHVYWKNPGDSGLPVKIKWDLPDGFSMSEIEWPTPDKITYDTLANYGYYNSVSLLQTLKAPESIADGEIVLKASVEMLVCHDICIPEYADISLTLNSASNANQDNSQLIASLKDKLPKNINGTFSYTDQNETLRLSLLPDVTSALKNASPENLEFFPYDWGIINHATNPDVTVNNGTIKINHARGDESLSGKDKITGLLVQKGAKGENKGFIVTVNAVSGQALVSTETKSAAIQETPTSTQTDSNASSITWISAIYLALLGGIVLNLMPCVFPVLSMKTLSLIKMQDKDESAARMHGVAYTAGIILSFLAIGGSLIILKEAGAAIGWGFQLQSPIIVAILAYLLFAIGLNLMGFFEFGSSLSNVGQSLTQGQSLSSSFFTGALATIVATPCTAPFMGAAMGFALTQPIIVNLSVFVALGFGLALPYLFFCFVPKARGILPRPGAWMDTFKQFLSFPMFASAVWLIWVLGQQTGLDGVLYALLGLLMISVSVWVAHVGKKSLISRIALIISLLLIALTLSSLKSAPTNTKAENGKEYAFGSEFSQTKLAELLEGDDPIFVEMTAAWCLTCKLNHAAAINIEQTKTLFKQHNVNFLVGDWTNQDAKITEYLSQFDRNGVPLYVFYGKRDLKTNVRPEAILLPQLLTPAIIKQTIVK